MIGPVGNSERVRWGSARVPRASVRPADGHRDASVPVPLTTAEPVPTLIAIDRADAPFLVQLISARDALPQSRDRRRAEPADGTRIYRAMIEQVMSGHLMPVELAVA